ncbi:hypothetical protein CapIbe_020517 [Capra ibex]
MDWTILLFHSKWTIAFVFGFAVSPACPADKPALLGPRRNPPHPRDLITSPGPLTWTVPASLSLPCWRVITKPRSAKA